MSCKYNCTVYSNVNNPPPPPPHTHIHIHTCAHTHTHTHTHSCVQGSDYEQCSCIADRLISLNTSEMVNHNSTASKGLCDKDCGVKRALLPTMAGILLFLVFMQEIPDVITTIQSVKPLKFRILFSRFPQSYASVCIIT